MTIVNLLKMLKNPDEYFFRQETLSSRVLNYGCGNRKKTYETGVDVAPVDGADCIIGESDKLPYDNDSFDYAVSRYVLEHVKDIYHVIYEVGRVVKPGGAYRFVVPHAFSKDAFDDPTHVRYFTYSTPDYFVGDANIHYARSPFNEKYVYLRLSLGWPRLKLIRYPANSLLAILGYVAPRFSENLIKLPFITGAVYCELTKRIE